MTYRLAPRSVNGIRCSGSYPEKYIYIEKNRLKVIIISEGPAPASSTRFDFFSPHCLTNYIFFKKDH